MLSSESCHFYSWIRFERMHLSVYVLSLEWIFTHPCLFIFAFFFIYMKCQASSASTMICWNQVIQGRHICTDGRISSWYSQAPSMCCRNEEVPKSELTHHTRWKQNFFFWKKIIIITDVLWGGWLRVGFARLVKMISPAIEIDTYHETSFANTLPYKLIQSKCNNCLREHSALHFLLSCNYTSINFTGYLCNGIWTRGLLFQFLI